MSTPRTHGSVSTVKDGTLAAISEPSLLGQSQLALVPLAPPPNPSTEIATNDCQMHILCVKPDEDVLAKLMILAQKTGKIIVVVSGSGIISSAKLATFGIRKTYKGGKYHINNISGSIKLDDQGIMNRSMLTITMSGPDGQAIVGCLAGPLIADSDVEVIAISYQKVSEATG